MSSSFLARGKRMLNLDKFKLRLNNIRPHGHRHRHRHRHTHDGPCNGSDQADDGAVPEGEIDVEKGEDSEEVILSVDPADCPGCVGTVRRGLQTVRGIHRRSIKFNPVVGVIEFSFDPRVTNVSDVVREASQAAKLRNVRVVTDDETLDVLASGDEAKRMAGLVIDGLNEAYPLSKKIFRLVYNPKVIGARALAERVGFESKDLAPHVDPAVSNGQRKMYEKLRKTLLSAFLTIPVAVLAWAKTDVDGRVKATVSLVLATLVQFIAVPDFYQPAITALIHSRTIEMDLLVVISITAAYLYSVVAFGFRMAGNPLEMEEFFETSTLLITLVLLGRLIASFARMKAVAAVSFRSLRAATATLIEDRTEKDIDARLLQHGDVFKVGPHATIPTDGKVASGSSEVDEAMLTGETLPVSKGVGSLVRAGTMNGPGVLTVELTRLPGRNTVTDIAKLVEEAANSKPALQNYADKVASWFVPVVAVVALICFAVWIAVGFKVRNYSAGKAVPNAITYAVATLAVSCPCALGLAVPMVLVIAGGIAAKKGVVIKSAECTERARKVTDVVFDKTGTITESDLSVVEEVFLADDREEAVGICKAVVAGNKHPVSASLSKHLESQNVAASELSDVQVVAGAGIRASLGDDVVLAGNAQFTNSGAHDAVSRMIQSGMTIFVVTRASQVVAVFGFRPRIRSEAIRIIQELKRRKIEVHLVSGDQPLAVKSVADEVGVTELVSQSSPAEKRDYVVNLMKQGKVVLFAGDGTNDAVAVTQANVGVQIGEGSEITCSAADVVLMSGLEGILVLLEVSKISFTRMVFNFVWSAFYNVLAILLASGAFLNVRIEPAYAGAGELVSILPVVLSAASMHFQKIRTGV